MKRYILTVVFSVAIVGLYQFIDIRLFNLDLSKRTKEALFVLRNMPDLDETVVLCNVGKLGPDELQARIDSLLTMGPTKIGINLCHWDKIPGNLIDRYQSDPRVLFANCSSGMGALSQVIEDKNTVTHFRTDRSDYFELLLTGFKGRGNDEERINYGPRGYRIELAESVFGFDPDNMKGKTVLVGYMGDYLTEDIHYYQSCRITPLNSSYGQDNILPDMYDIEISLNILRTINHEGFINEVNQLVRVLFILAFSLVNVTILTFMKTRWTIVNLVIAALLFVVLTGAGSFLIVLAFDQGYYLEMDELPLILLVTTVFVVLLNTSEKRKSSQQ